MILEGKYLTNKGKELIIKLGDSMNNNRLSSTSSLAGGKKKIY